MKFKIFIFLLLLNLKYFNCKQIDCSKVTCINPICGPYETLVILPKNCCGTCQPCPDKIPCLLIYRECNFGEQPTGCCPCQTKNINLKL